MTNSTEIEDIETILNLTRHAHFAWHPSYIECHQKLSQKSIELIESLRSSAHTEVQIKRGGQYTAELTASETLEVRIDIPKGQNYCLSKTPDDLLSFYSLHALPNSYALVDPFYKSWENSDAPRPSVANKIIAAQEFIKLLEDNQIIELDRQNRNYIIHTHNGKTCIPFHSERGYIEHVSIEIQDSISAIRQIFKDSLHTNEKIRIFKNAIADSMRSCDLEMRLRHLLKHAPEITNTACSNYDLFVSSFSFQDDQEKLYEQKREFNVRLNALLSGIQGKLLAIPVSTILATSQFKDIGDENYLLINTAIIFSSAFFTLIIIWLIKSQLTALDSIKTEIEAKEKRFKVELPRIFNNVEKIFKALKSACSLNTRVARIILGLSISLFVITFYVYVLKTPPLQDLAINLYKAILDFISSSANQISSAIISSSSNENNIKN